MQNQILNDFYELNVKDNYRYRFQEQVVSTIVDLVVFLLFCVMYDAIWRQKSQQIVWTWEPFAQRQRNGGKKQLYPFPSTGGWDFLTKKKNKKFVLSILNRSESIHFNWQTFSPLPCSFTFHCLKPTQTGGGIPQMLSCLKIRLIKWLNLYSQELLSVLLFLGQGCRLGGPQQKQYQLLLTNQGTDFITNTSGGSVFVWAPRES